MYIKNRRILASLLLLLMLMTSLIGALPQQVFASKYEGDYKAQVDEDGCLEIEARTKEAKKSLNTVTTIVVNEKKYTKDEDYFTVKRDKLAFLEEINLWKENTISVDGACSGQFAFAYAQGKELAHGLSIDSVLIKTYGEGEVTKDGICIGLESDRFDDKQGSDFNLLMTRKVHGIYFNGESIPLLTKDQGLESEYANFTFDANGGSMSLILFNYMDEGEKYFKKFKDDVEKNALKVAIQFEDGSRIVYPEDYQADLPEIQEEVERNEETKVHYTLEGAKVVNAHGSKELQVTTKPKLKKEDVSSIEIDGKSLSVDAWTFSPYKDPIYANEGDFPGLKDMEEGEVDSVQINFKDGSILKKGDLSNQVSENEKDKTINALKDGTYTLGYFAYKSGSDRNEDLPMVTNSIDPRVKLVVKEGKKYLSFLNHAFVESLYDLYFKIDDRVFPTERKILEESPTGRPQLVEYTVQLDDLEAKYLGGVLLFDPGDKGNYDQYKNFDFALNYDQIKEGFTNYKFIEDRDAIRGKNDEILDAALIRSGIQDTDGDGKISPQEMREGKCKPIKDDSWAGKKVNMGLDLEGLGLTDIRRLKDLGPGVDAINLVGNDIEKLPDNVFSGATNLKYLFLSSNKIYDIAESAFDGAKKLEYIDAGNNPIERLEEGLFKTNTDLKKFRFSDCRLSTVPEGLFKTNAKLETFDVDDNNITSLPKNLFANQGRAMSRIQVFNNELEVLPDISHLKGLEKILAHNNKLKEISGDLSKLTSLQSVDLRENYLTTVPPSLLQAMVKSSNKESVSTSTPFLCLYMNNIKDFPIDETIEAMEASKQMAGGGRSIKLEIGKNQLNTKLSQEEVKKLERIGVSFEGKNAYFPQKSSAKAEAIANNGKIQLKSELDLLELYFWDYGDYMYGLENSEENWQSTGDLLNYLSTTGRDLHNVSREMDRKTAIKDIMRHKKLNWTIETQVVKNKSQVIYEDSQSNKEDGLEHQYTDPNMVKGDSYEIIKTLYTPTIFGPNRTFDMRVSCVALEGTGRAPETTEKIPEEDTSPKEEDSTAEQKPTEKKEEKASEKDRTDSKKKERKKKKVQKENGKKANQVNKKGEIENKWAPVKKERVYSLKKADFYQFVDVRGHWAEKAIEHTINKIYFVGTSQTTYSPNVSITGGEFVTVLGRRSQIKEENYSRVGGEAFYGPYCRWAEDKGLLLGLERSFDPTRKLTREEMAIILCNYVEKIDRIKSVAKEIPFNDSHQFSRTGDLAIRSLTAKRILVGIGQGKFGPQKSFTRAEIAQVLYTLDQAR